MNKPLKYGLFLTLTIGITFIVTILIFEALTSKMLFFSVGKLSLLLFTSFIASLIITIIIINTIPYFKKFLLEQRSMIRFQNLSHPLLVKLSLDAPGTYHHSMMVGNLAYKAAKEIKADAISTRIGAYYHDIGKLKDPNLFIENYKNQTIPNYETIKDLKKVAKEIIDHVEYGLVLAKKNNLPPQMMAFIAEHHGTTSTMYFYDRAKIIDSKISISDFTYPGPKPLSEETAIVMLADAIEAKLRLIKDINPEIILKIVDETIEERIKQKQLDLSGIDHVKIRKIRNSFIETLHSIHHQRIEYNKS